MRSLILPRELPNGSVEWAAADDSQEIGRRLREGDATLGWPGDPDLTLVRNTVKGRWEVWRRHEDGSASIVMQRSGDRLPGTGLICAVRDHDTRLVDVLGDIDRHNDALDAARRERARAQTEDAADKLAWALGKDLDLPAAAGKVFPLS